MRENRTFACAELFAFGRPFEYGFRICVVKLVASFALGSPAMRSLLHSITVTVASHLGSAAAAPCMGNEVTLSASEA